MGHAAREPIKSSVSSDNGAVGGSSAVRVLAANVPPPDPFNRRYTTPPGGYPAHRRAARLSYAVWAVVGGQAQPVLDARTTAERLALALRRLEALCDGLAAEGG